MEFVIKLKTGDYLAVKDFVGPVIVPTLEDAYRFSTSIQAEVWLYQYPDLKDLAIGVYKLVETPWRMF